MAKPNKKGRSDYQSFVRIDRYLINSDAYRSLSPCARALHIEIKHRYNGRNNGEIALSERLAAERVGVSRPTIRKAFQELQDRGFILATRKGTFGVKLREPTLWALTDIAVNDALPSKDFMRWKPQPKFRKRGKNFALTGKEFCPVANQQASISALTGKDICPVRQISSQNGARIFTDFIIPSGGVSKPSPKTIELTPKPVGAKIRQNFFMHHIRRHLEGALL